MKAKLQEVKKLEKKLFEKKNQIMKQYSQLKKKQMLNENEIKLENVKIERERDKILLTLIDLLMNKKVKIEIPNGYTPSISH